MSITTNFSNLTETEFDTLMNASFDEILITDQNGYVIHVNETCKQLYKLTKNQLIGKTVFELESMNIFTPSATKHVLENQKRIVVFQETCNGRKLMVTAWPVFNKNKELTRVVNVSRDITEVTRLEDELNDMQELIKLYRQFLGRNSPHQLISDGLVFRSREMVRTIDLLHQVAGTNATILFLGESGTGKEELARLTHKVSHLSDGPFIPVNCGAIPEALFESEMFGYEEGAFSGARKRGKPGFIQAAEGGTLFLDEVAEMPLTLQAKLLRFLQDHTYYRIGSVKPSISNVRILAATNNNIEQSVKNGKFRADLYYRLNVITVNIPPLRDRKEDILPLAHYFLQKFNDVYKLNRNLHNNILEKFEIYDWPGNIRELQNVVERIVLTGSTPLLEKDPIPPSDSQIPINESNFKYTNLKDAVERTEKRLLMEAAIYASNTREIASFLGVDQSTVVRKMKKYNIHIK